MCFRGPLCKAYNGAHKKLDMKIEIMTAQLMELTTNWLYLTLLPLTMYHQVAPLLPAWNDVNKNKILATDSEHKWQK